MMKRSLLLTAALSFLLIIPAWADDKKDRDFDQSAVYETKTKYLDIKEVYTKSGLAVWLVEDHSVPVISLRFAFSGQGSVNDPKDKQGLARLVSNTMDEGAGDLDSQAFQKELSDHSISLLFESNRDTFGGHVKTLTKNKQKAFDLLRLALMSPRFDEEPVERMRQSNLSRIRHDMTDPDWMVARLSNAVVFEGHPYSMNSGGTLTSLSNITRDDLKNFAKTRLAQNTLNIAMAGDITVDEARAAIEHIFGELPKEGASFYDTEATVQNQGTVTLYKKDVPQSLIEISMPGLRHDNADFTAAEVMNFIYGGSGFGSRLTEEIREKRGLTYGIYSSLSINDLIETIEISTSTKNQSTTEMLSLIKGEMDKLARTPPTADEVKKAIDYLIGSVPLQLTSTDSISAMLLTLSLECLGAEYLDEREEKLQKIIPADVQRIAQEYLDPTRMTTVIVGQPEGLTPTKTLTTLPDVE